jgi:transcriptional regulator with XRE-family HTH domain
MAQKKSATTLTNAGPLSGREQPGDMAKLFARIERTHPGIENKIGVSSAALRAGQIVRSMRKSRRLTQTELADMLGWDQVRISNIERGEGTRGPTFDVLQKIADVCAYAIVFESTVQIPEFVAPEKIEQPQEIEEAQLVGKPFAVR